MKKVYLTALYILILAAGTLQAQTVNPLQTGHYAPGFINVRDLSSPPSGMFFLLYDAYIWSDTYIDRNGNKLKDINLSEINPKLPDVNINMKLGSFATIPVIAWASKFKILGATYMPMIMLPGYTYADGKIFGEMVFGVVDTTVTFDEGGKVSGFSDLLIQLVGLAWGGKAMDFMFTYGIYTPTGRYKTGADDNIGLGYWTHQFQGFGYYYPIEDKSTALMLGLTYEINSEIIDAKMKPGSRLTLEWGLSQYLSERFEVGIQGGHNWQVSDDVGKDEWWDPSVHDKKSTMAFSANYWVVANKLYFALKNAFDFCARQRFKTNMMMLNIIYSPGILTGN